MTGEMTMTCKSALALLAVLVPATAQAQGLPDLSDSVTQSSQIVRAGEVALEQGQPQAESAAGAIDGEAGVYVMTLNDIFRISGSAVTGYTDNPERNVDTLGGDGFAEAAVTAGVVTRLGGSVDFALSGSVGGRDYFDRPAASNRNLSGTASLGANVYGPFYVNVVGYAGWNYDRDFRNGVAFRGTGANLSALVPVTDRLALRPGVGANRQWSARKENNSTTFSGSLEAFYQLAPAVSLNGRAAVSRRRFDDFYEDVTFVTRKDWSYAGNVALAWQFSRRGTLGALLGYEKQDSTFFLASYDSYEGAAVISFALAF